MTCVVGIAERGHVYLGADSAGVEEERGLGLTVRADTKVFRNGPMIMGFTTSFRMGQLLRWSLRVPEQGAQQRNDEYMVTTFLDAVRTCLKTGGYAKKDNDVESSGTFIVGYHGTLFVIYDNYQVAEPADQFDAIGSGAWASCGALYATKGKPPASRLRIALQAAERMNAGVRRPFKIISSKPV